MDKVSFIKENSKLALGFPMLNIEESVDNSIFNSNGLPGIYVLKTLYDYYKYVPYTVRKQLSYNESTGIPVNISDIKSEISLKTGSLTLGKIFFTGVYGLDYSYLPVGFGLTKYDPFYVQINSGATYFDRLLTQTFEDVNIGDPYYEFDEVTQVLTIISGGAGVISANLGFGFEIVDYLPVKHLNLFSKMVAKQILLTLKASRSTISYNDVTFDTMWMDDRLLTLTEEIRDELQDAAPAIVFWG